MNERTLEDYTREARRILDDRRDQGWVFGVCATLARRAGWELWVVRVVAAVLLLVFTFWTALAYFVLAMVFHETRPRAQGRMMAWARRADDLLEAVLRGLKKVVTDSGRRAPTHEDEPASHRERGERRAA